MNIVVVDDAENDLLLASRILGQCKLLNPILTFSDGAAFVEYVNALKAESGEWEPSIIFLDLLMPGTGGLGVLGLLQTHEYARHSIVVMMSGLNDIKAINEGYQRGARTFLVKPITTHDVVQLINSLKDRVAIEEREEGYLLHWKERLAEDSDLLLSSRQAMTFSA